MKPPGTYKLAGRNLEAPSHPTLAIYDRGQRIVDSLRSQILSGGPQQTLRIRQVFSNPREIYRVEIEEPEQNYQRTTLLDRDALEDLLEMDEVRERVLELAM
jgi:hypothetical protein